MIIFVAIFNACAKMLNLLRGKQNHFNLSPLTFNLFYQNFHHLFLYVNLFGVG